MHTGNFHVFFPNGCFRKKPTPRRNEIFAALDSLIAAKNFNLTTFDQKKQAYIDTMLSNKSEDSFKELNEIILPLFNELIQQGFTQEELRNIQGAT